MLKLTKLQRDKVCFHHHDPLRSPYRLREQDFCDYLKLEVIDRFCLLEPVEENAALDLKSELKREIRTDKMLNSQTVSRPQYR